jgi:hypothetical protein
VNGSTRVHELSWVCPPSPSRNPTSRAMRGPCRTTAYGSPQARCS